MWVSDDFDIIKPLGILKDIAIGLLIMITGVGLGVFVSQYVDVSFITDWLK